MAMRPCEKCLENNWKFQNIENLVKATCQMCGHEVEWEPQHKTIDKSPCRKCGGVLGKHFFRSHKKNASYWFLWGWKCAKCKQIYNDNRARVTKAVCG